MDLLGLCRLTIWTDVVLDDLCLSLGDVDTTTVEPVIAAIATDVEPAEDDRGKIVLTSLDLKALDTISNYSK